MPNFHGRIKMHYVEEGEGSPVLFLHGLTMDHTFFAPQFEELPDSHRCVALDLRGHGHTEGPPGPWSMQDFVDDVVDFIRGVELAPCHLVGHSLGAMVALAVVVEHQELVRSLVVFGGSADDDAKFADGFRSLMALIERDGVTDQVVQAFTNICFGPRYREESPDGIAAYHDRLRTLDPKTIVEGLRAIAGRPSLEDRLATITIPTLVLHGDQDGRPASDAETIAHGIPGAELVRFPVGHTIQLEAPDAVNEALARFLRP